MESLKDLVFRYGVLFRKRFSEKQKLKFLQVSQAEFERMGYKVDVTQAKLKAGNLGSKNYYNLYAGNFKNADIVVSTYYDTGVKSFNIYEQEAFSSSKPKSFYLVNLLIQIIIIILFSSIFVLKLVPKIQSKSFLSLWGLISALFLILGLFLVRKTRNGIENYNNMVRNNSSVVTLFALAEKLKNKNIAFSLLDDCTNNSYIGIKLLEDYLPNKNIKKIYIDSIGNPGDLLVFTNDKFDGKHRKSEINSDLSKKFDYLITSGQINDKKVIIKDANTGKDNELSIDDLSKKINKLNNIINQINNDNNKIESI